MDQHTSSGDQRRREYATGHDLPAGRGDGPQTHEAQQRAGQHPEGGRQSRWPGGRSHGHESAAGSREHARENLQGSETLITPVTEARGTDDVQRTGDRERYRYGGEARSTHGHASEPRGEFPRPDARGQQRAGGERTGGRRHESGDRDTAETRRRYAHTDQTQYGGTLEDEPGAVEQTRTRENQSRTVGDAEGSHQHRRRHGSPQAEQRRPTRQGRAGSAEQSHSEQSQGHVDTQFGGDRGRSARDRRFGSRHGHGTERRHRSPGQRE